MPQLQVSPVTAQIAHESARARLYRSQLQQAHANAVARAAEIANREPHLVSIFDLGEVISQIEADQLDHGRNLELAESIALNRVLARLKQLIPV
jgi:hypothetical protein